MWTRHSDYLLTHTSGISFKVDRTPERYADPYRLNIYFPEAETPHYLYRELYVGIHDEACILLQHIWNHVKVGVRNTDITQLPEPRSVDANGKFCKFPLKTHKKGQSFEKQTLKPFMKLIKRVLV